MTTTTSPAQLTVASFDGYTDHELERLIDHYAKLSARYSVERGPEHQLTEFYLRVWANACGQQLKRDLQR
jgi:hypothetical protein